MNRAELIKAKSFELSELLRATLGKEIGIDITVTNVPDEAIESIQTESRETLFKDFTVHIGGTGFMVTLESAEIGLPF